MKKTKTKKSWFFNKGKESVMPEKMGGARPGNSNDTENSVVLFPEGMSIGGVWYPATPNSNAACAYAGRNEGVVFGYRKPGNNSGPLDFGISVGAKEVTLQVVRDDGSITIKSISPQMFADALASMRVLLQGMI